MKLSSERSEQLTSISADTNGSPIAQHPARDEIVQQLDREVSAVLTRALALYPQARTITLSLEIDRAITPPAPVPRSRAGGLARARNAIRAPDGTFLGAVAIAAVLDDIREARARGGRARARTARRAIDGTFLPA
jgi:hypothetical protein